jgi:cell division transport system permease protein
VRLNSLIFLLHEGFLNIRRNGLMSLAALGTVTVALTVLGASLWTAYRIHEIAAEQPQTFNEIDVFLKKEIDRDQALDVQERIRRLPEVQRVHLVSRERAWAEMQNREPTLTQVMPDNPLSDKFEVGAKQAAEVDRLARILRDSAQFAEVDQVNDASQEVRTMLGFARIVKVMGGCAAIGLFIATLFIVQNTIRLTVFARRREIRIMQLVGATPGFIRFPLMFEGVFHGIVGAAIAGGLVLLGGREVSRFVAQLHSPLIGEIPSHIGPIDMVSGLIAIGAFIGLVGSHLSMRRFLKQI